MSQPANTLRATKRPDHVKPPAHWAKDTGPPAPMPAPSGPQDDLNPTRYGDWVLNGLAIDF